MVSAAEPPCIAGQLGDEGGERFRPRIDLERDDPLLPAKAPVRQAIGSWRRHAVQQATKVRLADPFKKLPAGGSESEFKVHAKFGDENVVAYGSRMPASTQRRAEHAKTASRQPVGVRPGAAAAVEDLDVDIAEVHEPPHPCVYGLGRSEAVAGDTEEEAPQL